MIQHHICRRWARRSFRLAAALLLAVPVLVLAVTATIQEPENKGMELEEKDLLLRQRLAEQVDKLLTDPELAKKIQLVGKRRTAFCNVCHGKDGNAVRPGVPNLAGQNPVYLLDQFQRFSDGRRYDYAMTALSSSFSADEKVHLALYFSQMTPRPATDVEAAQVERGRSVYRIACAQCHGENGRGDKGYARLASQKADYVLKMLKEFSNYTGRRSNPWMTAVALGLSEQEMVDVAAYVSTLE